MLLLAQWVGVPSDLWIVLPRGVQIGWTVAGWLLVVAMAWVSLPLLRRDGVMRMWACGMVLALIPVCAAFPMDRLLLFASLGAAGLIAGLAGYAGYPDGERRQGLVRWVVIALLVLHLPISALLTPAKVVHTSLTLRMFDALDSRLPEDPQLAEQQVVLINGVEFMGFYARLLREESGRPAPAGFDWLAHPLMQMEITRSGDHTLTIRPEGGYLSNAAQALCRSPSIPFTRGQVIERSFMTVTIDELTDDHRPAVVTFQFSVPLEDPSLRWFAWERGKLVPFEPPAIGMQPHPILWKNRCRQKISELFFFADDIGAEGGELLFDRLVSPVDMVDAPYPGFSFGDETGDDEGGAGAEVRGHDVGAGKILPAGNQSGILLHPDISAKTAQLGDVYEPVVIYGVGNRACAFGESQHTHELCLQIGGKTGIWSRADPNG